MFAKETEQKINEAVILELDHCFSVYGTSYNSLHEGYAVCLEEVEEAEQEFDYIKNHLAILWDNVKVDDVTTVKANARAIAFDAVQLAKEACQIAAVARKIIGD